MIKSYIKLGITTSPASSLPAKWGAARLADLAAMACR